ncbi:hypothetical protein [Stenotrophobium rhamnosiphilum]|uniref:Uncharacterized protein n=1 Tax=Stenotrophobium rhamnosiphilum TaxID=2029166 RepID=A0A2T5MIL4_9GAMM|nr:hypothetical protein [Stenotrophobium rhamnosiphilum]PTU32404.1 hypothetical protein CJD38_07075 [Stenotrophobium rhamnosiphilum]
MSFIGDYQRESKRQTERSRCLHYAKGARCDELISAHSIQSKGQLSLIAERGHVYRVGADISLLRRTQGLPQLIKVGVNKASTFAGFCKHHDNELFEPIDNFPFEPVKHQVALYAYRCLCREYFVKENALVLADKMKDHPELSTSQKASLKETWMGHGLGFAPLHQQKVHYDQALLNRDYEKFRFTCFTSSEPCNVQMSGLLYPDYDFSGQLLQDLLERRSALDLITFFTAPMREGWAFVFAWHVSSNQTCEPFIQSLDSKVANGEKLQDALLRFTLSCCENHAIRVSWWDGLDGSSKDAAISRIHLMTHPHIPVPASYLVSGCEGIANWAFDGEHTALC